MKWHQFLATILISVLTLNITPLYSQPDSALSISNLAIPESLGKIEDRFTGTSKHWVVYIQDVHAHLTAQENISAILEHLNRVYGIRNVGIEGGWEKTSLPKSWALPNSREKQMLSRGLFDEGYLSGPGYAALFSSSPMMLHGIEDAKVYSQNRDAYWEVKKASEDTTAKLDALKKSIRAEKQSVYNSDLLSFDAQLNAYREEMKAEAFISKLTSALMSHSISLEQWDQIRLYIEAAAVEKSMDKKLLESQAERLMQSYRKEGLRLEELLNAEKIPNEKLELYPEVKKYRNLLKIQSNLSYRIFFDQIEEAITTIQGKLFKIDAEKGLAARSERYYLAKKVLTLQATPEDIQQFEKQNADIKADLQKAGLEKSLAASTQFYQLAKKRDEMFYKKIISPEFLKEDVAIVTGGFHTHGLSAHLREAGISYIVISPDLANQPMDEKLYEKRMHDPIISSQTLASPQILSDRFDAKLAAKIRTPGVVKDIPSAISDIVQGGDGEALTGKIVIAENPDEKDAQADGYLNQIGSGDKSAVLFIQASQLINFYEENPDGALKVLAAVIANPANKINVLYQDLNEMLTLDFIPQSKNVKYVNASSSIDAAVNLPRNKTDIAAGQVAGMFTPGSYSKNNIKLLEPSLLGILVYRLLLDGTLENLSPADIQLVGQIIYARLIATSA